jgi:hypothetical protein
MEGQKGRSQYEQKMNTCPDFLILARCRRRRHFGLGLTITMCCIQRTVGPKEEIAENELFSLFAAEA